MCDFFLSLIWPNNSTPGYTPKKTENRLKLKPYTCVHSSTVHSVGARHTKCGGNGDEMALLLHKCKQSAEALHWREAPPTQKDVQTHFPHVTGSSSTLGGGGDRNTHSPSCSGRTVPRNKMSHPQRQQCLQGATLRWVRLKSPPETWRGCEKKALTVCLEVPVEVWPDGSLASDEQGWDGESQCKTLVFHYKYYLIVLTSCKSHFLHVCLNNTFNGPERALP